MDKVGFKLGLHGKQDTEDGNEKDTQYGSKNSIKNEDQRESGKQGRKKLWNCVG